MYSRGMSALLLLAALGAATSAVDAVTFDAGDDPAFASAILLEPETGAILFEHLAREARSPASTQKLLLQLVVMEAVADGRFSLEDPVYTSAWASRMGGSQVFLKQGEVFPLGELMQAIVISSANDACVAVAEHIGGSTRGFVELMNGRAASLGLERTHCVNVHGLDDTPSGDGNTTSAYDLARVATALLPHQQILEWSAIRYTPFRRGEFMLYTTNKLLGKFRGLDGLKTGYTQRAGFCLVATAQRRGMRLISVIMGSRKEKIRDSESARLLSWGFNHFSKIQVVRAAEPSGTVPLDWGVEPEVAVVTADSVLAVLTSSDRQRLRRQVELPELHPAPVAAGDTLGVLEVSLGDSLLTRVDLVAAASVERMTFWEKLMSYF